MQIFIFSYDYFFRAPYFSSWRIWHRDFMSQILLTVATKSSANECRPLATLDSTELVCPRKFQLSKSTLNFMPPNSNFFHTPNLLSHIFSSRYFSIQILTPRYFSICTNFTPKILRFNERIPNVKPHTKFYTNFFAYTLQLFLLPNFPFGTFDVNPSTFSS